jgi:hypothetical protein
MTMKTQTKTKEEKQNMTRTTELLKRIEEPEKRTSCMYVTGRNELKGRLDALKEELSFWEKSGFTEMLLGFPLIKERIASIQEEIKLIEGAI